MNSPDSNMKTTTALTIMSNLILGAGAFAAGPMEATLPATSVVVPLWPGGPEESRGLHEAEEIKERGSPNDHDRIVRNITVPDLEIFRSPHPNGCGIVIIPGGGYYYETMDKEGRDVARWFNSIGVTAFVLKYRLPNTDTHRFGTEIPLRDAQRALRLVRSHAEEWRVQSDHIGVVGFSAGGHLASTLGTHFDEGNAGAADTVDRASCRPDFLVLGYPVISMKAGLTHAGSRNELLGQNPSPELVSRFSNDLHVTTNTPPVFLFCASDDSTVKVENSLDFYNAARAAGVPAELHIFEKGGHGFGVRADNRAARSWPPFCESWLRERGLLEATAVAAYK